MSTVTSVDATWLAELGSKFYSGTSSSSPSSHLFRITFGGKEREKDTDVT